MILVDLDALLIRNPLSIRRGDTDSSHTDFFEEVFGSEHFKSHPTEFDIISSTDHGHSQNDFPYGSKWVQPHYPSVIRMCTGFVFFRFSVEVEALVHMVFGYQQGTVRYSDPHLIALLSYMLCCCYVMFCYVMMLC